MGEAIPVGKKFTIQEKKDRIKKNQLRLYNSLDRGQLEQFRVWYSWIIKQTDSASTSKTGPVKPSKGPGLKL